MKLHNLTYFSFKQLFRTPMKLVLYFALPLLSAAFLCLGLNLYQYASDNLDAVYNAFDIVAVPSFKGNIDSKGKICDDIMDPGYIGYFSCEATDYDLSALTALDGVASYDVRNQFGAYISNTSAKMFKASYFAEKPYNRATVICFTLASSNPVIIPAFDSEARGWANIPVHVKWAAARESDAPEMVLQNLSIRNYYEEEYTLESGKEYIAVLSEYHECGYDVYHISGNQMPFPWFTENYDGFWKTEMGDYYRQIAEAVEYSAYSLTAVTVNDLNGVPAFYHDRVWVTEGRDFTEEELESGAKVCLVSDWIANEMEWKIGDTIDMSFFPVTIFMLRAIMRSIVFVARIPLKHPQSISRMKSTILLNTTTFPLCTFSIRENMRSSAFTMVW